MNPLRPLTPPQLATLLASGDCPRPERIYGAVAGELGAEERDTVLAHASRCDACGAELALARAFAEPAAADLAVSGAAAAADIGWIVGELERRRGQEARPATATTTPELARVLPMPARSRRGHPGGWLAAAASVLLAVGGLYLTTRTAAPPSVPPPPTTDDDDEDFTDRLEGLYEEFTRLSDEADELRAKVDAAITGILSE